MTKCFQDDVHIENDLFLVFNKKDFNNSYQQLNFSAFIFSHSFSQSHTCTHIRTHACAHMQTRAHCARYSHNLIRIKKLTDTFVQHLDILTSHIVARKERKDMYACPKT